MGTPGLGVRRTKVRHPWSLAPPEQKHQCISIVRAPLFCLAKCILRSDENFSVSCFSPFSPSFLNMGSRTCYKPPHSKYNQDHCRSTSSLPHSWWFRKQSGAVGRTGLCNQTHLGQTNRSGTSHKRGLDKTLASLNLGFSTFNIVGYL